MNKTILTYLSCTIMAIFAAALTITSPFLPVIASNYSVSMTQSGVLFTSNFIGFTVFVLIGGILADKWSKKLVLSFALAGFAVALLVFPMSTNFTMACFIMLFIGGFGGIIESTISAFVADLNPLNTSYYINMTQVFFGIGALIGPISAGAIVSAGVSWRTYYYLLGIIVVILSIPFILVNSDISTKSESITWASFLNLMSDRKFIVICVCMALYTGTEVGTWGWMSTFLKENMKFSIEKSSIAVGVFWVAMTLGRLLCGQLMLKFEAKKILLILSSLASITVILSGLVSNEAMLWIIIASIGLSFSSMFPLLVSYGESQKSTSKGTVFAILLGSGSLGTTIIPYFMGLLGESINIRAAMISPAIFLIIISLFFTRINLTSK